MRGSRKFTKRIDFYQTATAPDGFGGTEVTSSLVTTSWAEIKTLKVGSAYQKNLTEFGLSDTQNAVTITLRNRNDITYNSTMYFIYRGSNYIISTDPINEDFKNAYITFIAVRQVK